MEQIRSLAGDERARRALGAFGRQFVVEKYSLQNAASRLAEFCRSAAAQRPSPIQLAGDALRTSAIYLRERRFLSQSREQETVKVA